jgi:hypothetical protein
MRPAHDAVAQRGTRETLGRWGDRAVLLLLFAGTIWYLRRWPHDLFSFDEGLFLYEARRLLDGDRFYRDFFEIITPGSFYVMAGAFWAFGLSMTVARATMAVVHALIGAGVYAICRTAGVRVPLAAAAALSHLALCYWGTTYASPHWFSTLLMVGLLLMMVRWRRESIARALAVGILAGCVVGVQQQRGVPVTIGVLVALAADHLVARRIGRIPEAPLGKQVLAYGAGVALVVVPLLGWCVYVAGFDDVFRALVRHPLVNYRSTQRRPWGFYWPGINMTHYLFPELIARQWIAPAVAVPRIVWGWLHPADGEALRTRVALTMFAVIAMASVWYYPDYIHLAIVGSLCLPVAADTLEGVLRGGERRLRLPRAVGAAVALGVLVALGLLMRRNLDTRWALFSHSHVTAFGRIEFREADERMATVVLHRIIGANREIFAYPQWPSLYLLTGARNPTRLQVVVPGGYTDQDHIAEILKVLEERKVQYVAVQRFHLNPKDDPVMLYLRQKYQRLKLPDASSIPLFWLYERRGSDDHTRHGPGGAGVSPSGDSPTVLAPLR